jgi:multicomponent K+:H+ antiporter subunit A
MALIVTGTGGFAMFAGVLIIGHIVGSYDLDAVLRAGNTVREHRLYPAALGLARSGTSSAHNRRNR